MLITEITIPESVNQIGNNAFSGCTALTEIHYAGTEANWANVTKGENWIDESCTVVFDKTEEEPAPEEPAPEEPGTGEGSGESGNDENQSPDVPENGENDNPVTEETGEEENGNEGML